jgi:hypothetical protein
VRNDVKVHFNRILSFLVALLFFHSPLFAQSGDERGVLKVLKDSIRIYEDDLDLLQRFLEASTVDQRYFEHADVKEWVISNPVLRDSLFYALLSADSSLESEAGADAVVLATNANDLIEIRFGTAVFKGMTLQKAINRPADNALYRQVANSYRYSRDIELRDPTFKLNTPLQPELLPYTELLQFFNPGALPEKGVAHSGQATVSLYGLSVGVGSHWGGEIRLGVDEINNPFWANGTVALLAIYDRVHFGLVVPIAMGKSNSELFPPDLFRGRRFSGAWGVMADFDFGPVGGLFSVTRFSRGDIGVVTDPSSFDYIAGVAQVYYSFGLSFDPRNFVRAKVGGGIHRITHASFVQANPGPGIAEGYIALGKNSNLVGPFVKIEYLNRGDSENFRAALQFYNLTFLFTGGIYIIPDVLELEAKYVWPLGGPLRVWEIPGFLMVSPRIHVTF